MSEAPKYEGKDWNAAPEAYDELTAMREKKEADRLIAEDARREELQKAADERYPVSNDDGSVDSDEAKAA